MSFRISGLSPSTFAPLFALSDAELTARRARRMVADRKPGFPCRVSLRDAEVGETVLLVNYEHLPVDSPFRSGYAVYVRQDARSAQLRADEIPEQLASRLLSVRGFDRDDMLVDATVTEGHQLAPVLERALESASVAYIHVHFAKPGCFAARVDRVAG